MASLIELLGLDPSGLFPGPRIPRPAPADEGIDHLPGNLCWGAVGNQPTPELAPSNGFNIVSCNERYTEVSRKTVDVRIENPDDAEQYIDVNRANELQGHKRENTTGPKDNSDALEPEGIGDFSPSPIVREGFKPLGTGNEKRCKFVITLNNGPREV